MNIVDALHERSGCTKKLVRAVIKQLGYSTKKSDREELLSTLRDAARHGAAGGFGGFTYYTDTCKFYQRNKKDILARLKEQASDFGHKSVTEMVKSFSSCADADEDEIGRALFGRPKHDETTVENCLAWYALEEVARGAEDLEEG